MNKVHLTKRQRVIVIIYLLLVLYVGVVKTPWYTHLSPPIGIVRHRSPLWQESGSSQIDSSRLFAEIGIATIILGVVFLAFPGKEGKKIQLEETTGTKTGKSGKFNWKKRDSRKTLINYAKIESIAGVKIICAGDACKVCKKVASEKYAFNEAPLIPLKGCTHERGCICCYAPYEKEPKSTPEMDKRLPKRNDNWIIRCF